MQSKPTPYNKFRQGSFTCNPNRKPAYGNFR